MRSARALLLVPAALLAAAAAGCGGSGGAKTVPAGDVALVGSVPVTRVALADLLAETKHTYQLRGNAFPEPGTPPYKAARNTALATLVREAELQAKAKDDLGIRIADGEVDQRVRQIVQRDYGGSMARLREAIAAQGLTERRLRTTIRQQILGEAVYTSLGKKLTISDNEVEAYYDRHRKGYEQPAHRQIRHILVRTRAQAEDIVRRLRGGEDFASLAKRVSIDTVTRPRGGRVEGGLQQGQAPPAFDRVAFSLETNAISEPVHTAIGWDVIQATSDVVPAGTTPLAQVKRVIEGQLAQQKQQDAMTAWAQAAKAHYASKVLYAAGYGPATTTRRSGR